MPAKGALDVSGLDLKESTMKELLAVDTKGWKSDLRQLDAYFEQFGKRFPHALKQQMDRIRDNLD